MKRSVMISALMLALAAFASKPQALVDSRSKELCPAFPFIAVTGRPTEADVVRKVKAIKDAGFDQFLVYARSGLQYVYMGEEWLRTVETFCREGEKLGMKVWLYDEYNWPSGTCRGRVPAENVAWRHTELGLFKNADGSFVWQKEIAPHGWVNALEPAAIKRFIELTHKVYEKRLDRYFKNKTIPGIFTDEPGHPIEVKWKREGLVKAIRWWSTLEADYRAETGRDFRQDVEKWAKNKTTENAKVWSIYAQLMGKQFRKAYFDQIREWCDSVGIYLTGHLIGEQWPGTCGFNGDVLHALKGIALPGMDEIYTQTGTDAAEWMTLNVAQHAVRRLGRGGLVELFGCGPNDMTPARLRQMIWLTAMHGIDHYLMGMEAMDAKGMVEKHGYSSPMNESQPWHSVMRPWLEDTKTAARFARKEQEFEVSVRYPQAASARSHFGGEKRPGIVELLREFDTRQVAFDLCEETEATDKRFVFSIDDRKVTEERTGRTFASPAAAAEWAIANVPARLRVLELDGLSAKDIIVRTYKDGAVAVLNLQPATTRRLIAVINGERTLFELPARGVIALEAGEKFPQPEQCNEQQFVERQFSISIDRANVMRVNFDKSKIGTITLAKPLKGIRFILRECALSYALTEYGRPVDSFEKAPEGEKIFRYDAVPYSFELNGKPLNAVKGSSVLGPEYDPLYRETAPMDLEPGTYTLKIVTGEADVNFFLPAVFVAGEFAVFDGVMTTLPKVSPVGSLVTVGLGYYAGAVTYSAKVTPPIKKGRKLKLDTGGLYTSVKWNGKDLGVKAYPPYEWAIPDGDNIGDLEITIYTPFVNIFGDYKSPIANWDMKFWNSPRDWDYAAGLISTPKWKFK